MDVVFSILLCFTKIILSLKNLHENMVCRQQAIFDNCNAIPEEYVNVEWIIHLLRYNITIRVKELHRHLVK